MNPDIQTCKISKTALTELRELSEITGMLMYRLLDLLISDALKKAKANRK